MKTVVSASNTTTTNSSTPAVPIVLKTEPVGTDDTLQFQAPNATAPITNIGGTKRPMSLDLNKTTKKQRLGPTPLLLESPDMQNIGKTLNTPDIEKILLSSNLLQTPQPGTVFTTKGPVTSEQEAFGKGFEEALHSLHNSKNSQALLTNNNNTTNNVSVNTTTTAISAMSAVNTGMSGGTFTYTNLETYPVIKDEPQNTNASPPVSPIDMETQEKIKLERKRQRNRVAASKCRKRKLERISKLEDKVKMLKGENSDLALVEKNLKDHVAQLKLQVMEHIDAGCNVSSICSSIPMLQSK